MAFTDRTHPDTLVLFDVDGTLTPARKEITPEMLDILKQVRKEVVVGFVGGSDFAKQEEQLGKDLLQHFDY
ncbi:Phosphomannomutase 1, partial [Tieghemiomyces parasiticus]